MKPLDAKPKKRGRIALIILLVLIFLLGVSALLLRRWLSLGHYILTTSPEAVQSDKAENDKKTNALLNELIPNVTMRDLTEEERALLASGALAYEDALALIRGETVAPVTTDAPATTTAPVETEPPVQTTAPEAPAATAAVSKPPAETTAATKPPAVTTAVTTAETTAATEPLDLAETIRRQEEIIAEIYLLRATYLNEIDKLIKDTKQMYIDLPKEQKNLQNKMKIVEKMIPVGNKLEDECDAKMETLLAELSTLLKKQNLSTAIVDEIRKTYAEQKNLKLAELYNQYGGHLEK